MGGFALKALAGAVLMVAGLAVGGPVVSVACGLAWSYLAGGES